MAMGPALEILRARKTELFKAEGSKSIQGALDILNKTDGHIAYVFLLFILYSAQCEVSIAVYNIVRTSARKSKIPTFGMLSSVRELTDIYGEENIAC